MKGIISANDVKIRYSGHFMSLTDMSKARGGDSRVIGNWLRSIQTLKFLEAIEKKVKNNNFNYTESGVIREEATDNAFMMSAGQWIQRTSAILMKVQRGKYGGTYAHRMIALHFANWLSPDFYASFVMEYDALLEEKYGQVAIDRQVKRRIATPSFKVMTKSIKVNSFILNYLNNCYL